MERVLLNNILVYARDKDFNSDRIKAAFDFAVKYHRNQLRKSGEPYIIHPLTVASYLVEHDTDEDSIIAALLHDIIEDTTCSPEIIEKNFGKDIAEIIDLLSKKDFWKTDFCKMKSNLDEMEHSPKSILIKLADRLHNIQTIQWISEEKQREQLKETKELLLPLFQKKCQENQFGELTIPFRSLLARLEKEVQILEERIGKVDMPQETPSDLLGIVKYKGIEGIRQVYLEVLKEAQITGENILAFENGIDMERIGNEFMDNYIKQRIESEVMAYVISPDTDEDRQYKKYYEGNYTFIRLLPDFPIKANINIVGDLVMSFTLNPAQGTLRRNAAEAETQKIIFNTLWEKPCPLLQNGKH